MCSMGVEAGVETSSKHSTIVPAAENLALTFRCILGLHVYLGLMLGQHSGLSSATHCLLFNNNSYIQMKTVYCHSFHVWCRISLLCACLFAYLGFPLFIKVIFISMILWITSRVSLWSAQRPWWWQSESILSRLCSLRTEWIQKVFCGQLSWILSPKQRYCVLILIYCQYPQMRLSFNYPCLNIP